MTSQEGLGQLNWQYQPEPPVKRRRWPTRLAIALLVLAALFTAADRITVGIAENEIAKRIQSSQNLASKPSVTIAGFPFLTQLIGMKLDKVSLDARGVTRNGVRVTDLRADLHGVAPSDGFKQASVDTLDGTAFFSWTDLQAAAAAQGLDVTLAAGPDGSIRVTGVIPRINQKVTLESKLTLSGNNKIGISAAKVETAGVQLGSIPHELDYTIPVGTLPMGMRLHDFQVSPDGLRVSASAQNVTITGSGVSASAS